jgi:glycerol uptake facilitator-like aquaporin
MTDAPPTLARSVAAEALGTAGLLTAVVGSGIMAEHLADGSAALALLANSLATGGALLALILTFGGVSGAHFNPAVTLAHAAVGALPWRRALPYVAAQTLGAFAGVAAAHAMFDQPIAQTATHVRRGGALAWSEFVATFGLLAVIWGSSRQRPRDAPFAVAAYVVGAYWFTASTAFANPAVTLARAATDTFAGIRPADVAPFVVAQLLGAAAATLVFRWLVPPSPERPAP